MKQVKVKVNYTNNYKEKYARAMANLAKRKENAKSKDNSSSYCDTRAVCHSNSYCAGANLTHDCSNN